ALGAIRPAAPVLAVLGGEAGLTCHLSAPTDPEQVEVKWLRPQPPQVVHVFRDGQDQEGEQVPEYGGRTALEKGSLLEGNVTLRIRDLRLSDRGEYWCLVQVDSTNQQNATVELEVAVPVSSRLSPSAMALAVILPALGLLIVVGIYVLWKQHKSKETLLYQQVLEIEELLTDHGKEKGKLHRTLKKLRGELKLKRAAANAGWRRARLHPVDVTLDPDTAHPKLVISEDRRWVKHGDKRQDVPDNPERFDYVVSVLGSQRFTAGSHYWEVHVGNKTKWILGVCSESVSRKGKITASPLTGHWVVRLSRGNEYEALTSPQTPFRLKNPPRRVGIFLDYDAGVVSFYNVTDETHIYTFTYSFSGPLRPFFEPCLHDEGKNAAPLIICPVSQESEELARGPSPSLEAPWGMGKKVSLGTDGPLAPPRPAPDRYPLKDMILSWPSDLAPALQSFRAPSF
ncbi:erythroid membrane-associated protein, partial [Ornithorhynchus anatinus]|uniref:erythroid membrane-associated protein n=1 Tax=Ornithorhynchus anatinus TaxID=9258 RepID=UPI0019D4D8EF